jgi:hypothetical protein
MSPPRIHKQLFLIPHQEIRLLIPSKCGNNLHIAVVGRALCRKWMGVQDCTFVLRLKEDNGSLLTSLNFLNKIK